MANDYEASYQRLAFEADLPKTEPMSPLTEKALQGLLQGRISEQKDIRLTTLLPSELEALIAIECLLLKIPGIPPPNPPPGASPKKWQQERNAVWKARKEVMSRIEYLIRDARARLETRVMIRRRESDYINICEGQFKIVQRLLLRDFGSVAKTLCPELFGDDTKNVSSQTTRSISFEEPL